MLSVLVTSCMLSRSLCLLVFLMLLSFSVMLARLRWLVRHFTCLPAVRSSCSCFRVPVFEFSLSSLSLNFAVIVSAGFPVATVLCLFHHTSPSDTPLAGNPSMPSRKTSPVTGWTRFLPRQVPSAACPVKPSKWHSNTKRCTRLTSA